MAEEAIVDHDIAIDLPNASRRHLPRQGVDAGERVRCGQDRAAERVGLGVIEIGEGHRAVRQGPAAKRQVAARDEDEVSLEHAVGAELAGPIDRCREAVVGAEGIQRQADREQFSDGPGEEQLVRSEGGDDAARLQVDGP